MLLDGMISGLSLKCHQQICYSGDMQMVFTRLALDYCPLPQCTSVEGLKRVNGMHTLFYSLCFVWMLFAEMLTNRDFQGEM